MGSTVSRHIPNRTPVNEGKIRICVAGFTLSHHTGRARKVVDAIVAARPNEYESWFYFDGATPYRQFINQIKTELPDEQQEKFRDHKSSPFVWMELPDGTRDAKGGRDRLCEWAVENFKDDKEVMQLASSQPGLSDAWVNEKPGTASLD